jgi:acyl transferase domain-containing protein
MDSEPFSDASSEPVYIGVNGFGIGGSYAHAALTAYRPSAVVSARLQRPPLLLRAPSWAATQSPPHFLLPLSAVSEEHLSMYEASLADYLDAHPQVRLDLSPSLLDHHLCQIYHHNNPYRLLCC